MATDQSVPGLSGQRSAWLEIAACLVFITALLAALYVKRDVLLIGFDGAFMQDLARRQFAAGIPVFLSSLDLYQGLGDIYYSVNFTMIPSFIAGNQFPAGDWARISVYFVAFLEMSGGLFLLGRALQLGRVSALGAALGLPLIAFPIFETGALYPIMALVPQVATFIGVFATVIWAFVNIGRNAGWRDVGYLAVLTAGLFFMIFCATMMFVLSGPLMLIAAISGTVVASTRRERVIKLIVLAASAAVMLMGPVYYLLGLLLNSVPAFFGTELENDRASWLFSSILFHWSLISAAGTILVVLAFIGAILAIVERIHRIQRIFAIALLSYFALRLIFFLLTLIFDFWRGPSPLYFEFFVLPLYAVFAALAVGRLFSLATSFHPIPIPPRYFASAVLGLAAIAALSMALGAKKPNHGFSFPPAPSNVTEALPVHPDPGSPHVFRGRVATLTGRSIDGPVGWLDLHMLDDRLSRNGGNEHRLIGLNYFGIPVLFQYSPTTSPAFHAVATRLLARRDDRQLRAGLTLRHYNPKILAMLGISYVLTDAPLPGLTPLAQADIADDRILAYRIVSPNVTGYGPAKVIAGLNATEILMRMASAEFDPKAEVLITPPAGKEVPTSDLVPVTTSQIRLDGISMYVQATSTGRSVLLLPLEFSQCLGVQGRAVPATIVRANLVMTAVIFEGTLDARIALNYGPFTNTFCRLRDLLDLRALGVQDLSATTRLGLAQE